MPKSLSYVFQDKNSVHALDVEVTTESNLQCWVRAATVRMISQWQYATNIAEDVIHRHLRKETLVRRQDQLLARNSYSANIPDWNLSWTMEGMLLLLCILRTSDRYSPICAKT